MSEQALPAVVGRLEPSVRPWEQCREHGPAQTRVWACPTCLVQLRDENERLREALRFAQGALLQCSPCMSPECEAEQREWINIAREKLARATGPNVGAKLPHAEQPDPERAEASRVGST